MMTIVDLYKREALHCLYNMLQPYEQAAQFMVAAYLLEKRSAKLTTPAHE
jgi:hypothetical protein